MHFLFSLPVVYRPHPLHVLMWLNCPCSCSTSTQVRIAKSWSEFCTSWSASMLCYNGWRACGVCALESSSLYCHPYFNYHFCLVVFCAHYMMDCVFWLLVFLVYTCPGLKCLLIATVLCVHVLVVAYIVQCIGFWCVYDYVWLKAGAVWKCWQCRKGTAWVAGLFARWAEVVLEEGLSISVVS